MFPRLTAVAMSQFYSPLILLTPPPPMLTFTILCLIFSTSVLAHSNGMDMAMDGAMSLTDGQMLPYLHFTSGDNMWFRGWVPSSSGAMVGTCIGLFLLALIERWIAACRAVMEVHWRNSAQIAYANKSNLPTDGKPRSIPSSSFVNVVSMRSAPPFIPAHDITRGILQVGQSALGFAFMLTAMTYQLGFILSIVVGLGVGETLFGRYINSSAHLM